MNLKNLEEQQLASNISTVIFLSRPKLLPCVFNRTPTKKESKVKSAAKVSEEDDDEDDDDIESSDTD